mmetsp:Transcript_2004/g.3761  ORF Transcript_2004/g.3761 Transcript_2004/m.3761 type:complete len:247 (+) Transcript_2004:225-965(+)
MCWTIQAQWSSTWTNGTRSLARKSPPPKASLTSSPRCSPRAPALQFSPAIPNSRPTSWSVDTRPSRSAPTRRVWSSRRRTQAVLPPTPPWTTTSSAPTRSRASCRARPRWSCRSRRARHRRRHLRRRSSCRTSSRPATPTPLQRPCPPPRTCAWRPSAPALSPSRSSPARRRRRRSCSTGARCFESWRRAGGLWPPARTASSASPSTTPSTRCPGTAATRSGSSSTTPPSTTPSAEHRRPLRDPQP